MSVESISLVLNHSQASGTDKLVLLGIANHDGDGGAWPSLATLARYANKTTRAVRNSLRRLEVMGELETTLNSGGTDQTDPRYRTNRYRITIPGVKLTSPLSTSREEVQRVSGGKPTAPEPSLEPSIENTCAEAESFAQWWTLYPGPRRHEKDRCFKKWKTMSVKDREASLVALPRWVAFWGAAATEERFIPWTVKWLTRGDWKVAPPEPKPTGDVILELPNGYRRNTATGALWDPIRKVWNADREWLHAHQAGRR